MTTIRCACLLAQKGTAILAVRVRDNDLWYLPGGKIEAPETPEQALIREVREELSIDLAPGSIRYACTAAGPAYPQDGDVELLCFSATWTRDIAPAAEISEVAWLGAADIHLFTPTIRALYERYVGLSGA